MPDRADIVSATHAIERHRAALLGDLDDLRIALRHAFDPRELIRAHPRAALIIAFTAGMLVRVLFRRRLRYRYLVR